MKVRCPDCQNRLDECPVNEHGFPLVSEVYWAIRDTPAFWEGGHVFYGTPWGEVLALCVLPRRDRPLMPWHRKALKRHRLRLLAAAGRG